MQKNFLDATFDKEKKKNYKNTFNSLQRTICLYSRMEFDSLIAKFSTMPSSSKSTTLRKMHVKILEEVLLDP